MAGPHPDIAVIPRRISECVRVFASIRCCKPDRSLDHGYIVRDDASGAIDEIEVELNRI